VNPFHVVNECHLCVLIVRTKTKDQNSACHGNWPSQKVQRKLARTRGELLLEVSQFTGLVVIMSLTTLAVTESTEEASSYER